MHRHVQSEWNHRKFVTAVSVWQVDSSKTEQPNLEILILKLMTRRCNPC